jgi:hypothetical protein
MRKPMSPIRVKFAEAVAILLMAVLIQGQQGCMKKDPPIVVPLAPADLTGEVVAATRIELKWSDRSNNEKGFGIQRKTGTGVFSDLVSVGPGFTVYLDPSVSRNTTYAYRVYAFNEAGVSDFSNEFLLSTWADLQLTTASVTDITQAMAKSGGEIIFDGGSPVKERGVVWSTSLSPNISLSTKTSNGTGMGSFTSLLDGLARNTTYHVRAYATNSEGTFYGNEVTFKTWSDILLTTMPITGVSNNEALSGGTITSDGGSPVKARGVVWSTLPDPTVALSTKTSNGTGVGTFYSHLIGLIPNTTYHVRAYATNSEATFYGNELTFNTWYDVEITTTPITDITQNSAIGGGDIVKDGGGPVLARGVVWSTSPAPTTSLPTKTSNGPGSGPFVSHLTGLAPNTTYYVRAYATNSQGTRYGNEVSFKTL